MKPGYKIEMSVVRQEGGRQTLLFLMITLVSCDESTSNLRVVQHIKTRGDWFGGKSDC